MDNLFQTYNPYEKYDYILSYPLDSEHKALEPNKYCHTQNCYAICDDKIKHIDDVIIIKNMIECLFFLYVDFGEQTWDDKYWFFIGKLKKNGLYFMYETDCSGTGFGLGTKSTLYLSKKPELLTTYGLTNKHRDLITKNIKEMRFTCPKEDHLWISYQYK